LEKCWPSTCAEIAQFPNGNLQKCRDEQDRMKQFCAKNENHFVPKWNKAASAIWENATHESFCSTLEHGRRRLSAHWVMNVIGFGWQGERRI
jgi:hypothetical protein